MSSRWFRHRAEPLLHERMWGCDVPPPDDEIARAQWHEEGAFDAEGRPVAWRQVDREDGVTVQEVAALGDDGTITVQSGEAGAIRTTLGPGGAPIATHYERFPDAGETYEYDEQGRLVAIEESPCLWMTLHTSERDDVGGRLSVEHDETGPLRITSASGAIVWERLDRPWEQNLRDAVVAIGEACRTAILAACEEHHIMAGTRVFGLMLTYVDQGTLHPTLSFGLEEDREEWRQEDLDPEEMAINLFYLGANHEGLNFVEAEISPAMNEQVLRAACIQQPLDPYRAVLGAVAAELARNPLPAVLEPTEDFVVFIAEHDEGFAPKVDSIRRHNPPERVARWEAAWPPGVPLGEDEEF